MSGQRSWGDSVPLNLSHAGGAVDPGQADPSVSPKAVSEAEVERLRAVEAAARALAVLVREEYPSDMSLTEIAEMWGAVMPGSIPPGDVEGLRVWEAALGEQHV